MKKMLFLMIISLLVVGVFSWAQSNTLPNDLGKIINTPEGLKKVVESKDPRFVIVDVRPETAYDKGHIPGAINIPVAGFALQSGVLDKNKQIIVYCNSGGRSYNAYRKLMKLGYKK